MITDEMVDKAIHAGTPKPNAISDHIYQAFDMRAALEAVVPMIRAEALEEAAQRLEHDAEQMLLMFPDERARASSCLVLAGAHSIRAMKPSNLP